MWNCAITIIVDNIVLVINKQYCKGTSSVVKIMQWLIIFKKKKIENQKSKEILRSIKYKKLLDNVKHSSKSSFVKIKSWLRAQSKS